MRKLLFIFSLLFATSAFAQNDSIYMHNGKIVVGNVINVGDFTVIFKYAGEDAQQTVSKYAIGKIVYGKSGRVEKVTDKIIISSKDDWKNVVLLEDKSEIAGLTKVGDVKGKTAFINYHTGSGNDKKSEERLKEAAAEMGCPFVLITADKDASLVSAQSIKKGIAFKY